MRNRLLTFVCAFAVSTFAQVSEPDKRAIDGAAREILAATRTPSASIAVVKDGKVAYAQAYGDARLEPKTPARPEMRYKIGSNSKQIVATAMLLLVEQGKVSLEDRVSKYLPGLTRAGEITIRQLLSHTAGYEDYYPLDYVTPEMAQPTTAARILDTWAKKPLNFDPGTKWQYSNTGYIIAGQIIEKASGMPLFEFLRKNIFVPLEMRSVIDADREPWREPDPLGYTVFALGPSRPVAPEGQGWLYAAGQLAMTASDLARWNVSLMRSPVLKPESLRALTTEVVLANGSGSGYALGLAVSNRNGRRRWSHGGGTAGFISANFALPDDGIAITVLTNQDAPAASRIAARIESILVAAPEDSGAATSLTLVKRIFKGLQNGEPDRTLLTPDAKAYFTSQAVADFAASLKPLGEPESFAQTQMQLRGGMTHRSFAIRTAKQRLGLSVYLTPEGKVAQFLVSPAASPQ